MKIVHVTHCYHPSKGGVQFFFKNISERLVKDYGDDVTVVTTNSLYGPERKIFKSAGPEQEVINGVKVKRFPFTRGHLKPYSFIAKAFKRLTLPMPENWKLLVYGPISSSMKKYLMNIKADAICGSSSNYMFMQLPLWRKCKFFYYGSIHFSENKNNTLFNKQVKSINASTLYLANTHFEIEPLLKSGVKKEKIFVLGTGVDMESFQKVDANAVASFKNEIGIPNEGLVIGYIGRVEITKNVLLAIKAFEKIAIEFRDAYLLIAGSGNEYVEVVREYCSKLSSEINSRIKWQINFDTEKKEQIFNAIDILVLPSNNESFGIVFLEAWSCKKPVIGADIGAVRCVINEGVDGFLMNRNDEVSLAKHLTTLLKDKDLRESMGKQGFEKVRKNYTWDIIVSRLRECYINAGMPAKKTEQL